MGKTHLVVALGVKAVENGFSVAFSRFDDLLAALKRDADVPPQRLRGNNHNSVALVIVDEVGFQPLTRDEAMAAALLDRLLHRCHVLNIRGRSYRLRDLERMLK